MKRTPARTTAKSTRDEKPPRVYDRKGLNAAVELLRELLMEANLVADRMQERGIESIAIPAGAGSEAYDRAKAAINAWTRGLRSALYEQIENPSNGSRTTPKE